jgi:hypothetical protein
MKLRGGEFSTGTMGNFQPELTFGPWRGVSSFAQGAVAG